MRKTSQGLQKTNPLKQSFSLPSTPGKDEDDLGAPSSDPSEESARDDLGSSHQHDVREKGKIVSLDTRFRKTKREPVAPKPDTEAGMSEGPSRTEIAAQLQAAEARTETRIVQLSANIEARATASAHKIDLVMGKIDALASAVSDMKIDAKRTRDVIWTVGVGAVIAILGLVVTLWIAGSNVQGNMISVFQAGLGVRAESRETPAVAPTKPPTIPPLATAPTPPPSGK